MAARYLVCFALLFSFRLADISLGQYSSGIPTRSDEADPVHFQPNPKTLIPSKQPFADQFWTYLLANNYKHWSPIPGKSAGLIQRFAKSDASPHSQLVKYYLNRTALSDLDQPAVGSIIVMENYRPDRSLETISVMYRSPGFDPQANDWYWIQYRPDGSVVTTSPTKTSRDKNGNPITYAAANKQVSLVGRVDQCIRCHQSAANQDLAFFNDQAKPTSDRLSLLSDPAVDQK